MDDIAQTIAGMRNMVAYMTVEEQVEEIFEKCEVLCIVCHRILSFGGKQRTDEWLESLPAQVEGLELEGSGRGLLETAKKILTPCEYGHQPSDKDHRGLVGFATGGCLFDGTRVGFPRLTGPGDLGDFCCYHRYAKDLDHIAPEQKREMRNEHGGVLGTGPSYPQRRLPDTAWIRDMQNRRVLCAPCHRYHSLDSEVSRDGPAGHQVFHHLVKNLGDPLTDDSVVSDWRECDKDVRAFIRKRVARRP
jgi:hypothetical protein